VEILSTDEAFAKTCINIIIIISRSISGECLQCLTLLVGVERGELVLTVGMLVDCDDNLNGGGGWVECKLNVS